MFWGPACLCCIPWVSRHCHHHHYQQHGMPLPFRWRAKLVENRGDRPEDWTEGDLSVPSVGHPRSYSPLSEGGGGGGRGGGGLRLLPPPPLLPPRFATSASLPALGYSLPKYPLRTKLRGGRRLLLLHSVRSAAAPPPQSLLSLLFFFHESSIIITLASCLVFLCYSVKTLKQNAMYVTTPLGVSASLVVPISGNGPEKKGAQK